MAEPELYDPPLIEGENYRFLQPILATATPIGGSAVFPARDLHFNSGVYVGAENDGLVFRGRPFLDPRGLSPEDSECYFTVRFSTGLDAVQVEMITEGPDQTT